MATEKSAGTVLFRKPQEFLLLHYPAGHWDFSKGNIERGEREEEAALRELWEETGIKASIIPGFRQEVSYYYRLAGKTIRKSVVYFLAETSEKNIRLSFEHQGFAWLPYGKAMELITFANSRAILRKAMEFLEKHKRI